MIEILQKIIDAVAWDQQNIQNQSEIDKKIGFLLKDVFLKLACTTHGPIRRAICFLISSGMVPNYMILNISIDVVAKCKPF